MASYKIDFISLNGINYEVQIDEGEWDSDNAVALIGSDTPFETQEDDSTDSDCWLRETTGYFRAIDKGDGTFPKFFNTSNDHWRVRLYDGTNDKYRFHGYIKQEEYNQDLFSYPMEVEIPIISHLTMMKDKQLPSISQGIVVVGDFLAEIMGDVYDTIYLPNNELGQSHIKTWTDTEGKAKMLEEVKWYLYKYKTPTDVQLSFWIDAFKELIDIDDSDTRECYNGGKWESCSYGDVLESICACFGWHMFEDEDHLICRDINTNTSGYRVITKYSLTLKEANTDWSTRGETDDIVSQTEVSANDFSYCSDDHEHEIIAPNSLVSMTSEAKAQTDTLFGTDKGEEVAFNGYEHFAPGTVGRVDVPMNGSTDISISQHRWDSTGQTESDVHCLFINTGYCGGELVAWKDFDNNNGKGVLLSRFSTSEIRTALSVKGYAEGIYAPIDNGGKKQHAYINISGTMKGGDSDSQIENYETLKNTTITVYVSMEGGINLTQTLSSNSEGKIDADLVFKMTYSNASDTEPTFAPGETFHEDNTYVGPISMLFHTGTSKKFVLIEDFKATMKSCKDTDTLWIDDKDWQKIDLQKIYGMGDDRTEVSASTKLGRMETAGALMDSKRNILKLYNSTSTESYKYKVFLNYPATYIGTLADGTGAEALIRRTFKYLGNGNSLDKMAVYVNDTVGIDTRVKYNDNKYFVISREWNYRDDQCKLTLLQTTASNKPVPENAVVLTFTKIFNSTSTVDHIQIENAIDCDVTIVYRWTSDSDKEEHTMTATIAAGNTGYSNAHTLATAGFQESEIDSISFSDTSLGYEAVINIA